MALLIPQAEIAGPSAVARVKETVNDSRQPSRAALEQQLGVKLEPSSARIGELGLRLPESKNVSFSPLARAVNALLVSQPDSGLKLRGSEPLWQHSRPPIAAQLTARLTQTVVFSGLFYESHLQQFATGLRPLSLMVREPQAGLLSASSTAVPQAPARGALLAASLDALDTGTMPGFADHADNPASATALPAANTIAKSSGPVPFSTGYGQDGKPANNALLLQENSGVVQTVKTTVSGISGDLRTSSSMVVAQAGLAPEAAGFDISDVGAIPGVGKHAVSTAPASAITTAATSAATAVLQDTDPRPVTSSPLPFATTYGQDGKPEKNSLSTQEITRNVQTTEITSAEQQSQLHSSNTVDAVIHPDSISLVRQQLELLSVPVFRWCGQAWPGTPLEWDVQRDQSEDAKASKDQASQPAWTTNLTLSMPALKSVQARLTLVGNTLQVRLVCDEDATLAVLDESRNTLAQRFAPLGLQLAMLHIGMADMAGEVSLPKI